MFLFFFLPKCIHSHTMPGRFRGITRRIHGGAYRNVPQHARIRGMMNGSALDRELTAIVKLHDGMCPPGTSHRARAILTKLKNEHHVVPIDTQVEVRNCRLRIHTFIDLLCQNTETGQKVVVEIKYHGASAEQYNQAPRNNERCTHSRYLRQLTTTMSLYATTHRMRANSAIHGLLVVAASDNVLVFPRVYYHTRQH